LFKGHRFIGHPAFSKGSVEGTKKPGVCPGAKGKVWIGINGEKGMPQLIRSGFLRIGLKLHRLRAEKQKPGDAGLFGTYSRAGSG